MNVTVKGGRRPADQVGATRQDVWLALKQSPEKFTTGEIAQKLASQPRRSCVI